MEVFPGMTAGVDIRLLEIALQSVGLALDLVQVAKNQTNPRRQCSTFSRLIPVMLLLYNKMKEI